MAAADLTAARLREIFDYNPATGVFTHKHDRVGKGDPMKRGDIAGSAHNKGYWHIGVKEGRFLAHRLAWLYMTGEWPKHAIDHINGDKRDNRFENLRDVDHWANMQNLRVAKGASRSGLLGARWNSRDKRWSAQITINGKYRHLGTFPTAEAAHAAYLLAKRQGHQGCVI